jgi:hypothetical protein
MEPPQQTQPPEAGGTFSGGLGGRFGDAIRYWERRRIIYNLVLSAVAITWVVASWPHFRPAMTLFSLLRLGGLALIANLFYCAAYLVDSVLQEAASGVKLKRARGALWAAGMLLACVVENYWIADEIYPYVS